MSSHMIFNIQKTKERTDIVLRMVDNNTTIHSVRESSPFYNLLRPNDIVQSINGTPVKNHYHAARIIKTCKNLSVCIYRRYDNGLHVPLLS